MLAVGGSAVAATFATVLAVTTLPDRAPSPMAVSSTTMSPFTSDGDGGNPTVGRSDPDPFDGSSVSASDLDATIPVRLTRTALSPMNELLLTGAPRSVAAPLVAEPPSIADRPELDPDVLVHLVTSSHVYRLAWSDLNHIIAPDGAVVVNDGGIIVGRFVAGRFVAE